jgi:lipoyl(octanoyl) transferase
MPYEDCWKLQLELVEARAEGRIPDTALFVEHPSVITLGRKTPGVREGHAFPPSIGGVPVKLIERGGEATYHGPGQLVVYPVLRLNLKFGPKAFLRAMEESCIAALARFGADSFWQEGKTGVWLRDSLGRERKIASLGIAVRKSVSYHGLALNICNDLKPFSLISPCGFAPTVMTNLSEVLGRTVEVSEIAPILETELRRRLLPAESSPPEASRSA